MTTSNLVGPIVAAIAFALSLRGVAMVSIRSLGLSCSRKELGVTLLSGLGLMNLVDANHDFLRATAVIVGACLLLFFKKVVDMQRRGGAVRRGDSTSEGD